MKLDWKSRCHNTGLTTLQLANKTKVCIFQIMLWYSASEFHLNLSPRCGAEKRWTGKWKGQTTRTHTEWPQLFVWSEGKNRSVGQPNENNKIPRKASNFEMIPFYLFPNSMYSYHTLYSQWNTCGSLIVFLCFQALSFLPSHFFLHSFKSF